ncbi:hypothetical protein ACQP00_22285 [Dactylosporangium sp. CS-047395]|uniref:hypothetical protein n=1 Tax=Dactylosporangium sp. CS-047395 TaxID=3239936 RepID=UPI003D8D4064
MTQPITAYRYERAELAPGVLADWTVDDNAGTATGACPECRDTTTHELISTAIAHSIAPPEQTAAVQLVHCRCDQTHDEGQTAHHSCGRWWLMRVRPEGVVPRVVEELGDTHLAVAQALAAAHAHDEKTVRGAAEKWVGGVTTLLGLFGLSGIAIGKDATSGLGAVATGLLAGFVLLAFIAGVSAVVRSYLAAYGWPKQFDVTTTDGQRTWFARRLTNTGNAVDNLREAVGLALVCVVALAAAVGVLWFGGSAPKPQVSVVRTDDSKVCGELLDSRDAGTLRVRRSDGTVEQIPAAGVSKLTSVTRCPG